MRYVDVLIRKTIWVKALVPTKAILDMQLLGFARRVT